MEIIYKADSKDKIQSLVGVGLGNFDGLHVGHMALVNTLIRESKLNGLKSMVYTFTKHPESILRKKLFTTLLTSQTKKIELLNETALDYLYFDEFDENYSRMSPEEFVKNVLVDRLKVRLAVAGFNYRFGYKGEGDINILKNLGRKYGFNVIIIPKITIDDDVVSSTLIRQNVTKGDMETVFKLLGRHYSIGARVEKGKQLGNTLGFPTANIYPEDYLTLPSHGVYITKTLINGTLYSSITNIGKNPTFERQDKVSIETHIFHFSEDIYGQNIEVFFIEKIRGEKKFKGKDELVAQISQDVKKAWNYFNIG